MRNQELNEDGIYSIPLSRGPSKAGGVAKRSKDNAAVAHAVDDSGSDKESSKDGREKEKGPGKAKPGRKIASEEPADKKVAQQRAASRAFRERKANYIKELEDKVAHLTALLSGNASTPTSDAGASAPQPTQDPLLAQRVAALEAENTLLRQMTFSFDFKPPVLDPNFNFNLPGNGLNSSFDANSSPAGIFSSGPIAGVDQLQFQLQMQSALLNQLQAQQQQPQSHMVSPLNSSVSPEDSFTALLNSYKFPPSSTAASTASSSNSPASAILLHDFKASPVASPAPSKFGGANGGLFFNSHDLNAYRDSSATPPFDGTGGSIHDDSLKDSDLFDDFLKTDQLATLLHPLEGVEKETEKCTKIVEKNLKTVSSLTTGDVDELCDSFKKCSTKLAKDGSIVICPSSNPEQFPELTELKAKELQIASKLAPQDGYKVQVIMNDARQKFHEKVEMAALGLGSLG
ncbi:hypothetical protein BJ741DRAFT_167005 [Chytriomyces cf. hyalinus JEL632]|nr:hypothetical protein BJ741DRAFT_167005 [Chytriomyces cf. hyalinus JEL632]